MTSEVIAAWKKLNYCKIETLAEEVGISKSKAESIVKWHLKDRTNRRAYIASERKRLLTLLEGYIFQLHEANVGEATEEEINAIKTNYNRFKEQFDKLSTDSVYQ